MTYVLMVISWAFLYLFSTFNFVYPHTKEFLTTMSWLFLLAVNFASILTHFNIYINQCNDLEDLNKVKSDKKIYKERAEAFLGQIKNLLVEVYPQHEKDIYAKITSQTASTIFSVYPDIKSNATITNYVKELIEFDGKSYSCDLEMNHTIKRIEVRKRTSKLWVHPVFVPTAVDHKIYQKFYE